MQNHKEFDFGIVYTNPDGWLPGWVAQWQFYKPYLTECQVIAIKEILQRIIAKINRKLVLEYEEEVLIAREQDERPGQTQVFFNDVTEEQVDDEIEKMDIPFGMKKVLKCPPPPPTPYIHDDCDEW